MSSNWRLHAGEGELHKVSTFDVDPDHRITGYLFSCSNWQRFHCKRSKVPPQMSKFSVWKIVTEVMSGSWIKKKKTYARMKGGWLSSGCLKDQDKCELQSCLTVSQAIFYNYYDKKLSDSAVKTRHTLSCEPLLPIYQFTSHNQKQNVNPTIILRWWIFAFHTTELWNLRIGLVFQSVRDLKKMLLLHCLVFEMDCLLLVLWIGGLTKGQI